MIESESDRLYLLSGGVESVEVVFDFGRPMRGSAIPRGEWSVSLALSSLRLGNYFLVL